MRLPAELAGEGARLDQARSATAELWQWCQSQHWAGHDPYDALNSVRLQRWGVTRWALPRLAATQLLKRLPFDLRGFLEVPPSQNPKGIALFLSAAVRLCRLGMVPEREVVNLAKLLLDRRSPHPSHWCWGYNFDWQTRTYLVPRGTPNIICTTFAANALLDAHDLLGQRGWLDAAESAGRFLFNGLNVTREGEALCFSYTPLDRSRIHNASLLGGALLARLHLHRPAELFVTGATAVARFAVQRQRPDGSWPYGETRRQRWIDSFHTGYNLLALDRIHRALGLGECEPAIRSGYRFFLDYFFEPDGRAKYFHNRTNPVDIHSVAQALLTLCELAAYDDRSLPTARRVEEWALANMRDAGGWFYYQHWGHWINRINYIRWSQAWMLVGLARFLEVVEAPPERLATGVTEVGASV